MLGLLYGLSSAETTHSSKKGRFIGLGMGAFSLGQILGVPAGSILTAKFSWHVPFFEYERCYPHNITNCVFSCKVLSVHS